MRRREFIALLAGLVGWPRAVIAQALFKVYRVGVLSPGGIQVISDTGRLGAGLIHGFARRGYTIGGNLVLEPRAAEWHVERLPQLADELVASRVDVIIT